MVKVLTIGHSNHDIVDFLSLLHLHSVNLVVDVRSELNNRNRPQYTKTEIERFLLADQIGYVFLGDTLGDRPKNPGFYTSAGALDYDQIIKATIFIHSIERLVALAQTHNTVILCSEGSPHRCHRESILGNYLCSNGHRVLHILPNGSVFENGQMYLVL